MVSLCLIMCLSNASYIEFFETLTCPACLRHTSYSKVYKVTLKHKSATLVVHMQFRSENLSNVPTRATCKVWFSTTYWNVHGCVVAVPLVLPHLNWDDTSGPQGRTAACCIGIHSLGSGV